MTSKYFTGLTDRQNQLHNPFLMCACVVIRTLFRLKLFARQGSTVLITLWVYCHYCWHVYLPDSANMCAQTIFTALDHLTSWANEKRKSAAARRVKGQAQKSMYVSSQHIYIYDFTVWKLAYIYLSRMPAQLVTICQKKKTSVIATYKGAKTEYTYIVYRTFNHSVCVLWAEFYIYSCFPTFSTWFHNNKTLNKRDISSLGRLLEGGVLSAAYITWHATCTKSVLQGDTSRSPSAMDKCIFWHFECSTV